MPFFNPSTWPVLPDHTVGNSGGSKVGLPHSGRRLTFDQGYSGVQGCRPACSPDPSGAVLSRSGAEQKIAAHTRWLHDPFRPGTTTGHYAIAAGSHLSMAAMPGSGGKIGAAFAIRTMSRQPRRVAPCVPPTLVGGTGRRGANSAAITATRDPGGPSNRRSGVLSLEPLVTAVSMPTIALKTTQRRRSPIPAQPWGTVWWCRNANRDMAGPQGSRPLGINPARWGYWAGRLNMPSTGFRLAARLRCAD